MDHSIENTEIVFILTIGLLLATVFGYLARRCKLSPILGYLCAGYLIGPYSPGFVADSEIADQLASVGVILMMFWVGLHLNWQGLLKVRMIAFCGAIGQTLFATIVSCFLLMKTGYSLNASLVIGLAIGIASTIFVVRIIDEHQLQRTKIGHITLGWLLGEDFIAIIALLILPVLASGKGFSFNELASIAYSFASVIGLFCVWLIVLFLVGRKFVPYVLYKVIDTETRELFTLGTLAIIFSITVSSARFTGTSIALGAFLAGLLIAQTKLVKEIAQSLVAMRDAFVAFFFLSIGMLFNPVIVKEHPVTFIAMLVIILVAKPLAAYVVCRLFGHSPKVSWPTALALAQVGEFSFILMEEATRLKIVPDDGFDLIVASAFISLALNPFLFKTVLQKMTIKQTLQQKESPIP